MRSRFLSQMLARTGFIWFLGLSFGIGIGLLVAVLLVRAGMAMG